MADWVLVLAGQQLTCDVPYRTGEVVHVEFVEPVSIKPGQWSLLISPGGRTRIAVEVGLPKSPTVVECCLLGLLSPTPILCLECGAVLRDNDVVRRVPGMRKKPARELCSKCWEIEAARQLRGWVDSLAWADDDDDDDVVGDEDEVDSDEDDEV